MSAALYVVHVHTTNGFEDVDARTRDDKNGNERRLLVYASTRNKKTQSSNHINASCCLLLQAITGCAGTELIWKGH